MFESLCSSTNLTEGRALTILKGVKYWARIPDIRGFRALRLGLSPLGQIQPAHLSLKAFLGDRETKLLLGGTQKG